MTETCTFSPIPTTYEDFLPRDGECFLISLIERALASMSDTLKAEGWEIVTGPAFGALPAGRTTAQAYANLKTDILNAIEKAGALDAVVLKLHGAMVADGVDDCEGDLLLAIRQIVGTDATIGVEIDPHAHLTTAMTDNADIICCYKEWPHTDILQRAKETAQLTNATARKQVHPTKAVFDCRMLSFYHTKAEPMKTLVSHLRELEESGAVLSADIVHGFMFGDTADTGTKILVTTDNDRQSADHLAKKIGEQLFDIRGKTFNQHLNVSDGIAAIKNAKRLPIIVADGADAPSGGGAGDATFLLHALIDAKVENVALAFLHDPVAVSIAFKAGNGARLPIRIGGKMGPQSGPPLDVFAEIVELFPSAHAGRGDREAPIGDIVHIRAAGLSILLSRDRPIAMDSSYFSDFGIDPKSQHALIVKSVYNHRSGFEDVAGEFINIDAPGVLDLSLRSLNFEKLKGPKWPLNPNPFCE